MSGKWITRNLAIVLFFILFALPWGAGAVETVQSTIDDLRRQARELTEKQSEMGWQSWVLGEPSNQAKLYAQYPGLFTMDSIAAANKALEASADPKDKKALSFLLHYLQAEYLYKQSAMLWDIYFDLESQLKILVDGKLVPYRDLAKYLSQAKSAKDRAQLAKEEYRIYRLLNDVVLRRELDLSHRVVKELGYENFLALAVRYRMIDLDEILPLCEAFLTETQKVYLDLFDEVSPIPRERFRRSDILYLLGAKDWDEYFPQKNMIPSLKKTLSGMGFFVDKQANLLMHTEPLPKKNPRAVCFAVRVPQDVRISIKPKGGKDDYSALFHEMGHAEHFANAKTDIWEFQELGSNAVTEGYAYLFEGLVQNPLWLKQHTTLRGEALAKYQKHALFSDLYMMRRYMAKLLYEVKLHQGDPDPQKTYQALMSRAYGFQLNEEESLRYLSDVDPLLYCVDYVQAFFIQAMLEKSLEKKFGKSWWTKKATGKYLRNLFAKGNELSGKELAELLGYKGLRTEELRSKYLNAIR